jgi:MOSC domain-containing protein YiiM
MIIGGEVVEVCLSDRKGVKKTPVGECLIVENHGLEGDSHASSEYHRQVCLLAEESITKMKGKGFDVGPGSFAENITTRNLDLLTVPIGTKVLVGEVLLEITQKGKECHIGCAVYQQIGECIARTEAIFGRVLKGGKVKVGDRVKVMGKSKP